MDWLNLVKPLKLAGGTYVELVEPQNQAVELGGTLKMGWWNTRRAGGTLILDDGTWWNPEN